MIGAAMDDEIDDTGQLDEPLWYCPACDCIQRPIWDDAAPLCPECDTELEPEA